MNDEKEETLKKQETEWMNNLCALINETLKNIESNINESYNILTKENNPSIEKKILKIGKSIF